MNILCFLGFHKKISIKEICFKDKNQETANYTISCSRCGKIIEKYGNTTFGSFIVDKNGIKLDDLTE